MRPQSDRRSLIEQLLYPTMRSQLVTLQVQAIAGMLVDTSRAQEDDVRVFVRVIHNSNICALSNPLKIE